MSVRGRRRGFALAAVCTLLFLTFLDNTIVSVALGDVQHDVYAGVQELQWIVNGYALVFASMMLVAGALGDRFGHRVVMFSGAAVFCAGSVICALSYHADMLIAGRAVMGLGAAASEPGTLSMLRHLYPGARERARATGVWAAVSGLALALGPVIGGIITGVANWHWIFWFNLIFGAAALAVAAAVLPETARNTHRRIDLPGAALGAGSLAVLVFGTINGETAGFGAPSVIPLYVAGGVGIVAFWWRQRHAANPLLDLHVVRAPAFAASNVVAMVSYFGTFAVFFFGALYMSVVANASGYRIALQFLPMMIAMIVSSLLTGRWIARMGARRPIVFGCAVFALGLLFTDRTLNHGHYLPLAISLTVAGIGIGITVVPTTFVATSAVPLERVGMASSAINTSREIGAVAGTAILGAIVNARITSQIGNQLDALGLSSLKGFVTTLVLHGGQTSGSSSKLSPSDATSPTSRKVLGAVYDAFYSGVHVCLVLSTIAVIAVAIVAGIALRHGAQAADISSGLGLSAHPDAEGPSVPTV